jgi:hypothetical protein
MQLILLPTPEENNERFYDIEEVQANVMRQMRAITKSDYQRYFRQWQ